MKTSPKKISLSQAISGFSLNIEGRRLSQHTIDDYANTMRKFQTYLGNPNIQDITPDQISSFLAAQPVSKKTVSNYHIGLSSMWSWLTKQRLVPENILSQVQRPKPESRAIVPLEEHEIRSLLSFIEKSKAYATRCNHITSNTLQNADRNRAIILFFLDNGVRVDELCKIKVSDLDIKNARCYIFGKGAKERYVPFSPRTGDAIWRYLTLRPEYEKSDYLFVTNTGHQLKSRAVQDMLATTGDRAGVKGVHPHQLRHTFAICFLRAGGDPFTLQAILGHEDGEMTRHYVKLANIDISRVHRRCSPVEFMRL